MSGRELKAATQNCKLAAVANGPQSRQSETGADTSWRPLRRIGRRGADLARFSDRAYRNQDLGSRLSDAGGEPQALNENGMILPPDH